MSYLLIQADARAIPLADSSVDCVVTSPPYWGLRDYGVGGQIGLEPAHDCLGWATGEPCGECWVCQMIQVFREARRVLKPWGTVWANLGDAYSAGTRDTASFRRDRAGVLPSPGLRAAGLPPKNLIGLPWRAALGLQADGWWLRSEILWAKTNPMPEAVRDRPSKAHETIFLLTKAPRYFYDQEAVRVSFRPKSLERVAQNIEAQAGSLRVVGKTTGPMKARGNPEVGANLKTVWPIPSAQCKEAHFAAFPEALAETCILAGTSAIGNCPACGRPWERVFQRDAMITRKGPKADGYGSRTTAGLSGTMVKPPAAKTVGWRPTCTCGAGEPAPAVVLDPFVGSGTTCRVADRLGRHGIGLDLNLAYLADIAAKRCAAHMQPVLPGVA
ncbi:MAG: site-specific DNA-methyltransferase [Deltaproteobacteria bacterium]|nr:site-specific DNA-methyltransferase [Deltaproteobacteria bacterium]